MSTAVSRALETHDVLAHIMEHVAESGQPDTDSLATLACVCSAFTNPALDVLWRDTNFENLVNVLRSSVQQFGSGGPLQTDFPVYVCRSLLWDRMAQLMSRQLLKANIEPREWARFISYSKRVKYAYVDITRFHSSLFVHLSRQNDGKPLLPAVQELVWNQPGPLDTNILFFVSPTVRTLNMYNSTDVGWHNGSEQCTGADSVFGVTLRELLSRVPYLEEADLSCVEHSSFLVPTISSCRALRTLKISIGWIDDDLDDDFMPTLYQLKSLVSLSLSEFKMRRVQTSGRGALSLLERLHLRADILSITHLLPAISAPSLRSLRVNGDAENNNSSFHQLQSLVAAMSGWSTLKDAEIVVTNGNWRGVGISIAGFMGPLLKMPQLEDVSFHLQPPYFLPMFTTEDVRVMAEAWPKLRSLSISLGVIGDRPALDSIIHFAQHCPQLKRLTLPPFDCRTLNALDSYPILSHGLESLLFCQGSLNILESLHVAVFISRIFPELVAKRAQPSDDKGWKKVLEALGYIREAQKQQIARLRMSAAPTAVPNVSGLDHSRLRFKLSLT